MADGVEGAQGARNCAYGDDAGWRNHAHACDTNRAYGTA